MQPLTQIDVIEKEKSLAAKHAVKFVKNGMKVGLGTGSTAAYAVDLIGKKVAKGLDIVAVASSERTAAQARSLNIPLTTLEDARFLDIYIDGTDEFDADLNLIKGGGGALLREKILSYFSDITLIICDSSKKSQNLGSFKLPVETIPLATGVIAERLVAMELNPHLRLKNGSPYATDEGNHILDVDISNVRDLKKFNTYITAIPGVVETGLFLGMADLIIMGQEDSTVVFTPQPAN